MPFDLYDQPEYNEEMYASLPVREGDVETLASEFVQMACEKTIKLKVEDLTDPDLLEEANVLAIHYSAAGAQGDYGVIEILYRSQHGIQFLHGNYEYGDLDLDAVIEKFPMIGFLDMHYRTMSGGTFYLPDGWGHMYMGAMHHIFCQNTDSGYKYLCQVFLETWRGTMAVI